MVMKHIVIDLEMNALDRKYKDNTLVKPQYNERIERKFEKLTGIKTAMVQNVPVFKDAIEQLLSIPA